MTQECSEKMLAWIVEAGELQLKQVDVPVVPQGHVLIEVKASSVNPGELLHLPHFPANRIPGIEAVGEVILTGQGVELPIGARVVANTAMTGGGWGQFVCVSAAHVGVLPDTVTWQDAASLGNAGLTAFYAVRAGGALLGARVLVTGVTGTVGRYAAQLAMLSGAFVTGTVRDDSRRVTVEDLNLAEVVTGNNYSGLYDVVIDSVGGDCLSHALSRMEPKGLAVALVGGGQALTASPKPASIPLSWEFSSPGARIVTLNVATEVMQDTQVARNLSVLGELIASGLKGPANLSAISFSDVGDVISRARDGVSSKGKTVILMGR